MTVTTHVFNTMGTTASLRFAGPVPSDEVLLQVEDAFAEFDRRFSLYRADSELSRIATGELTLAHSSDAVRDCYREAMMWSHRTAGVFTSHRPDGVLDLSGIVKAAAIAAAGTILDTFGMPSWVLNVGGDILTRGSINGSAWRIGITDPDARTSLLCALDVQNPRQAVATSGTAERGEHIWRAPATSDTLVRYRQVTVVADDIVTADVLATAILAGGPQWCDDILDRFDVDALTVDDHGGITASPGLREAASLILG